MQGAPPRTARLARRATPEEIQKRFREEVDMGEMEFRDETAQLFEALLVIELERS